MVEHLRETVFAGKLRDALGNAPSDGVRLFWLGQAGFIIETDKVRIVIDPCLSDSLAVKYQGTTYPHHRMMPPPIEPSEIFGVDVVLCTHAHTDHMDPGTLRPLMAANPNAVLVAPRAAREMALDRAGIAQDRLVLMNAGEHVEPLSSVSIHATRAAHENFATDALGNHQFLGYVIELAGGTLWHSGDCVPYENLVLEIAALAPTLALLPVNGRRAELAAHGVPGNFSLGEAVDIATQTGCTAMIAHHFGMFSFNTKNPAAIDAMAKSHRGLKIARARTEIVFDWISL